MTHPDTPFPHRGPRPLFFSGGTALRGLSRALTRRTHRSIHLITPFDSGGSSAALRDALGTPAVGDLRNRLLALADVSTRERRQVHDLLAHRLPASGSATALRAELRDLLVDATDEVRVHIAVCMDALTPAFDLRHASVGNLALTGAYLAGGRDLDGAVTLFARWISARGVVCPVSEDDLHLAAAMTDGTVITGQHRITKGAGDGDIRVARIFLTDGVEGTAPAPSSANGRALAVIGDADLICYPVGSFFTSVIAAVLPHGMGAAVAKSDAPKVYVPNPGTDPEERGMSLADRVRVLTEHLLPTASRGVTRDRVLDTVLIDPETARSEADSIRELERQGLRVHVAPLGRSGTPPRYADDPVLDALTALVPA